MRSTSLGLLLTSLIIVGCAMPRSGQNTSGSGGQTSGGAGSGGSAGSGGGSGGSAGAGGTTNAGGSDTGGTNSGGSGGAAGSGGGNGGSGGSGGAGGSGGTADAALTTGPTDAGTDQRAGDARMAGTGGAGGGATTQTGGAGGGAGTTGRGGGGGTTIGGTGGKPGTGGTVGTGGSTAPTPCSFPSSWNPGSATYTTYTLPNPITACGYEGSNNTIKNIASGGNFAAIPGNTSSDFNTRDRCGACVQIGSAIITIVDECPNDTNAPCKANPSGHLDLSNAGASAGGVRGDPAVRGQNQWKFVPCPINGNVMVRLKTGNSNEIFIENQILPISAVTCAGQTGSRTSYGAWHFNSNIPGASCDITDIANRKITVTAGSTQGQNVDTGVQFPKCL